MVWMWSFFDKDAFVSANLKGNVKLKKCDFHHHFLTKKPTHTKEEQKQKIVVAPFTCIAETKVKAIYHLFGVLNNDKLKYQKRET